jgi:urea transport system permease protein
MTSSPLTRALDRGAVWFVLVLAAIGVLVPLLNLFTPDASPWHVPTYLVALWGKYVCYAILALSIDLIWGYCGILSLGHGAFFALGGYAMGMYLMRQIGTRGVYGDPIRPDFMVFLNWPELPVYWYGFNHFAYAVLMVFVVPGVLAFVFGWFAFRSRVTGVYLSIITQALTFALTLAFFRNNFGFGGNNGLTDFKDILGFNVQAQSTRAALFAISVLALIIAFLICRAIVASKLGMVLVSIRDAEARTRFLGYRVENYKLFVFTLSACMAGVAGALYVPQVGIINPSEFAPGNSIEAVIWVAVGGRGTLIGAVIGAIVVNYGKTTFTSGTLLSFWAIGATTLAAFAIVARMRPKVVLSAVAGVVVAGVGWLLLAPVLPSWPFLLGGLMLVIAMVMSWNDWPLGALFGAFLFGFFITPSETVALAPYWLFLLGSLFVLVTLLLPRGIVGTVQNYWRAWGERKAAVANVQAGAEVTPKPAE